MRTALTATLIALPANAQTIAFTHVNVVNVESGTVARDQTILVTNGRITSVAATTSARVPGDARVTDMRDRFVIPGLWDMHAHLGATGRSSFALYLANGVTGVRDMGSNRDVIRGWRDSIARDLILAPRLMVAGPIVERAGWLTAVRGMAQNTGDSAMMRDMAQRIPVNSPESARQAVDSIISLGGDFVKVRNDPGAAATFALLRRARERGVLVAGHWPRNVSPEQASDSGYASLEHGPISVVNGALVPTLEYMPTAERRALFETFVKNGTAYTPTIVSLAGYRLMSDSAVARVLADTAGAMESRMRYVPSRLLDGWKADFALKKQETGPPFDWAAFNRITNHDLLEMSNAGVLILAGTDAGSPLVYTGFSLADELQLLVTEGRLTPVQSLRTATTNVATWMKARADFGTIEPGMRADLVVLAANPLTDIANVRRIVAVMRAGHLLDRAALDGLLASARRK